VTGALSLAGHLGLSAPDKPLLAHLGRSADPADQVDALADHGFAGLQDLFLKLRPPEEQAALASHMARRGFALTNLGADPLHWNKPFWSAGDESGRDAVRASVALSGSLSERFGGTGAVCVAGLDPDRSVKEQINAMIENLKRNAEIAERHGLMLLVEPIAEKRIPGLLLNRLEDGIDMVRAVDMPSVRLMFDTGHVAMMGHDVPSALAACAHDIGLIQLADVPAGTSDRVDPGLGQLDWTAILRQISDQHYDGLAELEFEPVDATADGEARMLERLSGIFTQHPRSS
jgi:hydroxypyruvate isomerase